MSLTLQTAQHFKPVEILLRLGQRARRVGGLALCGLILAGCAAKKPVNYLFGGCQVTRTWIDEQGRERKDCDCKNGREIGFDAKTRLRIIRCE